MKWISKGFGAWVAVEMAGIRTLGPKCLIHNMLVPQNNDIAACDTVFLSLTKSNHTHYLIQKTILRRENNG